MSVTGYLQSGKNKDKPEDDLKIKGNYQPRTRNNK